jgi:OOP family OmpA-OmpF porin
LGAFLTKYPDSTALIEGHTDNVGTAEYNIALSQRRADNVARYLVENSHIAPDRLIALGYGYARPLASNDSELGKRMNRRIDAVVACATDVAGLTVIPARLTMAMLIEYDQNSADLKPEYAHELSKVADFMNANPTLTATVEGHTGNLQADPEQALVISQRRAQNVVNYLVDHLGIARSRLAAEGFGQTRRVAYNTSREGQQENRRVNIIFNYAK